MISVTALVMLLVGAILGWAINSLLLWVSATIFKVPGGLRKAALEVAIWITLCNLVLGTISLAIPIGPFMSVLATFIGIVQWIVVGVALALWLVKTRYNLDWMNAVKVWAVWFVTSFIISFALGTAIASLMTMRYA